MNCGLAILTRTFKYSRSLSRRTLNSNKIEKHTSAKSQQILRRITEVSLFRKQESIVITLFYFAHYIEHYLHYLAHTEHTYTFDNSGTTNIHRMSY